MPAHQVLKERYRHGLENPFVWKVTKVAAEKGCCCRHFEPAAHEVRAVMAS